MKFAGIWLGRLVAVLAMVAGGLVWFGATAQAATVCGSQPVPPGYVITSETLTNTCTGGYLTETIQLPYNGIQICDNSPIPSGYVLTSNYTTNNCGSYQGGTLNTPYSGITICGNGNGAIPATT
ncbi:hypothetical protein E6W39_37650 [Kitasatospora acidiphila]|uniref:Uncharacterized protein n=1 Tax=Kitasatospora acidiphila TaxID=2567942 RepID=A0A540WEP5_9ACTN|nr:hypothetical protein [Kitasatospora acidiphila]TQF06874.1 hypothetical protein E6W39_37650 [Kitasatospora acidiphila]